jgi:hypothetical protein
MIARHIKGHWGRELNLQQAQAGATGTQQASRGTGRQQAGAEAHTREQVLSAAVTGGPQEVGDQTASHISRDNMGVTMVQLQQQLLPCSERADQLTLLKSVSVSGVPVCCC